MTMADLEQLLREHSPTPCADVSQRGRASVTTPGALRIDDDHGSTVTPALFRFRKVRLCKCGCGREVYRYSGTRREYFSDACKQKAYRERKKKQRA